jgi:hypothetical protein
MDTQVTHMPGLVVDVEPRSPIYRGEALRDPGMHGETAAMSLLRLVAAASLAVALLAAALGVMD